MPSPLPLPARASVILRPVMLTLSEKAILFAFGLEKFHIYIYSRHVTVQNDHKPLEMIQHKPIHRLPTSMNVTWMQSMTSSLSKSQERTSSSPSQPLPLPQREPSHHTTPQYPTYAFFIWHVECDSRSTRTRPSQQHSVPPNPEWMAWLHSPGAEDHLTLLEWAGMSCPSQMAS